MSLKSDQVILLIAGVLAIASWSWLEITSSEESSKLVGQQQGADYFSVGYRKQEMDEFGVLKSEIRAEKMFHYNHDGTVHLQRPDIRFFSPDNPPWIIKADSGVLSNAGKELWLNGAVMASRAASMSGRGIAINTSQVKVLPESADAETVEWAELKSSPDVTTGVGLKLHYADPVKITLLNQVRGIYEKH